MTVIRIENLGNPILRQTAKPVLDFDAELRTLVEDLRETLADSNGAGLSAPQLGVGSRVFVWSPKLNSAGVDLDHMVNPVLEFPDEEEEEGLEGCLSIPGIWLDTKRRTNVVAKGFTMQGDPVQVVGERFLARCIQHEADHLDGVLFIDRISPEMREVWLAAVREASWFDENTVGKIRHSPHQ